MRDLYNNVTFFVERKSEVLTAIYNNAVNAKHPEQDKWVDRYFETIEQMSKSSADAPELPEPENDDVELD